MDEIINKINEAGEVTDELAIKSATDCIDRNDQYFDILKIKKMASYSSKKSDYVDFFRDLLNLNVEESEKGIIIHLNKTECDCPMAPQLNVDKSKLCNCTKEHEKQLWSEFFGNDVDVEILESFNRGGNDCVIEIIL